MQSFSFYTFVFALTLLTTTVFAQGGYQGYDLSQSGNDPNDVNYQTANTRTSNATNAPPDVFLNASVSVGEIDIIVDNLTAKINLDAQVLQLLELNAGVDASIDRVSLIIKEVRAKVLLEARLGNVLNMIDDVLNSLDLNPILATLGASLGEIIGDVGGVINDTVGGLSERSFELEENILYSVNDASGNTHTNRVLAQNGDLVDISLTNDGKQRGSTVVGHYTTDMTHTGHDKEIDRDGRKLREMEYVYKPFMGLQSVAFIFTDLEGSVVETRVVAEAEAGGTYTLGSEVEKGL